MGNAKVTNKSYLFVSGYKHEFTLDDKDCCHRPMGNAITYNNQHDEIGCIKHLYWINLWCAQKRVSIRTLLINTFDVDTGEEMYWQFDKSTNKWKKRNLVNAENVRFFSSWDASVSFWINGKGQVFTEGYIWKKCVGRINSETTGLSKPVKIPFFDSIQEPVIDIFTGYGTSFALCGLIIRFDQILKICSFWISNLDKIIPNDIVKIIYNYIGNTRKIFSTGSYPNGHAYGPGPTHYCIDDWTEIAAFKDIPIVSIACERFSNCRLFLDVDGNVYQCHSNLIGREESLRKLRSTAPYLIKHFSENNIKIVKIICNGNWNQNIALDANGQVWFWETPPIYIPDLNLNETFCQPKPRLKKNISKSKIIDIQVRSNTYYAKTDDDKHYFLSSRIDKKFKRKTGCQIQNVCLGDQGHEIFIVGVK